MTPLAIVLALALFWVAITGSFSGANLVLGAAVGLGALLLLRRAFARPRALHQLGKAMALGLLFLRELMVSAIRVATIVVSRDPQAALRPAIVTFPLSVTSNAEITLLANLITLTPGTLSLDVSEDRSVLYVHVLRMTSQEAVIADIAQGFEARIKELFA